MSRWSLHRRSPELKLERGAATAGWYPDPHSPGCEDLRWWDGMQWTVHVRQPQSARVPERAASRADRSDSAEVVRLPDDGRQRGLFRGQGRSVKFILPGGVAP